MTRKDFELIARVIARAKATPSQHESLEVQATREQFRQHLAVKLAAELKGDSPSFRDDLFLAACKVSRGTVEPVAS